MTTGSEPGSAASHGGPSESGPTRTGRWNVRHAVSHRHRPRRNRSPELGTYRPLSLGSHTRRAPARRRASPLRIPPGRAREDSLCPLLNAPRGADQTRRTFAPVSGRRPSAGRRTPRRRRMTRRQFRSRTPRGAGAARRSAAGVRRRSQGREGRPGRTLGAEACPCHGAYESHPAAFRA